MTLTLEYYIIVIFIRKMERKGCKAIDGRMKMERTKLVKIKHYLSETFILTATGIYDIFYDI